MLHIKQNLGKQVALAAPTHAAAELLNLMGSEAITLAKLMDLVPNPNNVQYDATGGHEFIARNIADPYSKIEPFEMLKASKNGYIIIDESSMIDDGMLKSMLPILEKFNIRVIYIGDDAQLPPVGQMHSSAFKLDNNIFKEKDFETHELTMVMRTAESNPLFKIFTQLRNSIGSLTSGFQLPYLKEFTSIIKHPMGVWNTNVDENGDGLYHTKSIDMFYSAATRLFEKSQLPENIETRNHTIVIAGTRKTRQQHNNAIRKRVYANSESTQLIVGEKLLPNVTRVDEDSEVIKNSIPIIIAEITEETKEWNFNGEVYFIEGFNVRGTLGEIVFITKNIENKSFKSGDKNLYNIDSNKEWMKAHKALKGFLQRASGKERKELQKQMNRFESTFIRMFEMKGKKSKKGYQSYFDSDIDYGFATTIHKSQGSTYKNVLVDEVSVQYFLMGSANRANTTSYAYQKYGREVPLEADYRAGFNVRDRMLYTAFTRPTNKLFIFNDNNLGWVTRPEFESKYNPQTRRYETTTTPNIWKKYDGKVDGEKETKLTKLPPNFEYQTEGKVSYMPSFGSDLITFSKIQNRLKKHFPQISIKGLEKILKEDGTAVLGRALGMGVEWSKSKATMDTVPHEYAHIYLNLFSQDPVIKKMVKKYGNEELAIYMGEYYANTMTGGMKQGIKVALKNFWLRIKKQFKELSDAESKEYIAGSFFQGRKLGVESKFADGQWNFDTDDVNFPEYQEITRTEMGDNPAEKHSQSFFSKELGVRLIKTDFAILSAMTLEHQVFEDFKNSYKKFINKNYPSAKTEDIPDDFLIEFWNKGGSKVHRYDSSLGTGQLHLEVVLKPGGEGHFIGEKGSTYMEHTKTIDPETKVEIPGERRELNTKNSVPDTYMQSFAEMDGINVISLSLKDIVREVVPKDLKKEVFWKPGDAEFKMFAEEGDSNAVYIPDFEKKNYVYVASKGGDHSAILFTQIPDKYSSWNKEEKIIERSKIEEDYINYWKKEEIDGNITNEMVTELIVKILDNEQSTTKDLAVQITRHEWWKSVKYPKYLIESYGKSEIIPVQTHYDRIKIDFAKGYTVRDFGESSVMTVDSETSEFEMPNGENLPVGKIDGWMLSSGKWFKKLSDSLGKTSKSGRGGMDVIKGAVRARWGEGNNINYLGVKGLQMRPYKGMRVVDKNTKKLIAEYKGTADLGTWVDSEGNEFEHLSPTDTSKMTSGIYSNFNEINPLPENYQKILQSEPNKSTSAYPVTQGEMALNKKLLKTEVGKNLFEALQDYYNKIIKQYSDELTQFASDPAKLYSQLQRDVADGDIITELQNYIQVIGESGQGLNHPAVRPMWIDSIANKFIKHGLFKLRNRNKNMGTMLYYKPFYAPAFKDIGELKQGDFIVSKKNNAMVAQVIQAYQKSKNVNISQMKRNFKFWKQLNDWLAETDANGNYKNDVPVLLSRQPIAKLTGVVLRNIRHLAGGGQGQTMILTDYDVAKVFDGDYDGDKGMISVIDSPKLIKAFKDFQKSPEFKELSRAVNLKYWGKQLGKTTLTNNKDIENVINNINAGAGQIGSITNARNTFHSMHYKNLKIELPNIGTIKPFNPEDRIIMDYKELNHTDSEFESMFNEIYNENNDSIVYKIPNSSRYKKIKNYIDFQVLAADSKNKFYLETSKQNEIAIILQMAVDDSKWGLLGTIGFDKTQFINKLLFDGYSDLNKSSNDYAMQYINEVRASFNTSSIRQGYNENQDKMNLKQMFEQSKSLKLFTEESYRATLHNAIIQKIAENNISYYDNAEQKQAKKAAMQKAIGKPMGKNVPEYSPVQYQWNETLQESLLLSLDRMRDDSVNPNEPRIQFAEVPLYFSDEDSLDAHRMAIRSINITAFEQYGDMDSKKQMEGKRFAMKFSSEYYRLFDERDLSVDFSEEIDNVVSKYRDEWNNLGSDGQFFSTLTMFMGTKSSMANKKATEATNRMKAFFPMAFQNPQVTQLYFKLWDKFIKSPQLLRKKDEVNNLFKKQQSRGYTFKPITSSELMTKNLKKVCR